jgi:hypothetical protein
MSELGCTEGKSEGCISAPEEFWRKEYLSFYNIRE